MSMAARLLPIIPPSVVLVDFVLLPFFFFSLPMLCLFIALSPLFLLFFRIYPICITVVVVVVVVVVVSWFRVLDVQPLP